VLGRWLAWRNRRYFKSIGAGTRVDGNNLEVKGRVHLGAECVVRNNVAFRTHKKGEIIVGDGVEIADYALIMANDRVEIGKECYLGPHCVLRDTNHRFQSEVHWRLLPHDTQPIVLEAGCYIGARSYVMPGVCIGEGAVIAPGSIVARSVGAFEMWAGSPVARLVAHRTDSSVGSRRKRDLALLSLFGMHADADDVESS
jgi:acetyltransferase-like isoleucine patch superfamily enzyme